MADGHVDVLTLLITVVADYYEVISEPGHLAHHIAGQSSRILRLFTSQI